MNDVVNQPTGPLGQISKYFAALGPVKDELGAGIQASFGVIGYKGKVWSLRYRGETKPLMRKDGDGPQASIEVVIVKTAEHISKTWYETGYEEGSKKGPDCFSTNGIVPDPSSPKKQNNSCATCKQNAWGSRVVQAQQGGRTSSGKACSDNKRLAVVPLGDIQNEAMGGPMLLRVPPASLQDLALYGSALTKYGYPPCAVGTKISFDAKEAYPKYAFGAIRVLTDDEAQQVLEIQKRPIIDRILAETGDNNTEPADATPERAPPSPFEQPKPETVREPKTPSEPTAQRAPAVTSEDDDEKATGGTFPRKAPEPQIRTNPENRQEVTTQSNPPAELETELDKMLHTLIPGA